MHCSSLRVTRQTRGSRSSDHWMTAFGTLRRIAAMHNFGSYRRYSGHAKSPSGAHQSDVNDPKQSFGEISLLGLRAILKGHEHAPNTFLPLS
jgi:hypothetical protein